METDDQANFWEQQWFLDHVTSECIRTLVAGPLEPLAAQITAEHVCHLYSNTVRRVNISVGDSSIGDTAAPCLLAPPTLDTSHLPTSVSQLPVLSHASSEQLLIITQPLVHHFQQQQERLEFPVPSSLQQQQQAALTDQPPHGHSPAASASTSHASSSQQQSLSASSAAVADDFRGLSHAEAAQVLVRLLDEPASTAQQFEDQAGATGTARLAYSS